MKMEGKKFIAYRFNTINNKLNNKLNKLNSMTQEYKVCEKKNYE